MVFWSFHLWNENYLSHSQKKKNTDAPSNISPFNIHKTGHKRQFIAYIYPSLHLHKLLCFFPLEIFHVLRPSQIFSLDALTAGGQQTIKLIEARWRMAGHSLEGVPLFSTTHCLLHPPLWTTDSPSYTHIITKDTIQQLRALKHDSKLFIWRFFFPVQMVFLNVF